MTEHEWLANETWVELWWHAGESNILTARRRRLSAVAACRQIARHLNDPQSHRALEVCERDADKWVEPEEYLGAFAGVQLLHGEQFPPTIPAVRWAALDAVYWLCHPELFKVCRALDAAPTVGGYEAVIAAGLLDPAAPPDISAISLQSGRRNGVGYSPDFKAIWQHDVFTHGEAAGRKAQAHLLRDIFGNPFRSVTFAPEWRTSTAVALAQGMYESRDFSAMPILADSLQDAGCDNDDILNHCRDEKETHVRGCWVVDLVLGKE